MSTEVFVIPGNKPLYKNMKSSKDKRLKFFSKGRSGYLLSVGIDIMTSMSLPARLNTYVSSSVPYFLRKAEIFLPLLKLTRDKKSCRDHMHLTSIFVSLLLEKRKKKSNFTL